MRRTMLFLPGNTPNMLINGDTLGADTIIFDLEDAVSPDEKDAARILVRNALRYQSYAGCETVVRINPTDTAFWKEDLKAVIPLKPDVIMDLKEVLTEEEFLTILNDPKERDKVKIGFKWF